MPMTLGTDYEVLRGIDRALADLREESRPFAAESRHYRRSILARLDKLEAKSAKPAIDLTGALRNGWVQITIFLILLMSNIKAWDAAQLAFGGK